MRCVDLCLCYNGTRHNGTRHNHKLARPIERVTHTCIHSSYIFGCSIYHRWCSADMVTSVPFAMQSIYVMPNAPEPNLFPTPNCNLHFPIRPYSSIAHAFGINSAHYSTSSYEKRRKTKQNQNEHNLVPLTFHMNAWSPNNIVAQPLQLQFCVPRFSSAHTHINALWPHGCQSIVVNCNSVSINAIWRYSKNRSVAQLLLSPTENLLLLTSINANTIPNNNINNHNCS